MAMEATLSGTLWTRGALSGTAQMEELMRYGFPLMIRLLGTT
jgi:hypothetical protein